MSKKNTNYQEAVEELEQILDQIENGEPDVDQLDGLVKKAAALIKLCKQKLKSTEQNLNDTLNELE
ncbi:MAG: exodeoxyribonuclease VII small subunit [Fulvivirga sp.]|nr:exodeoxyribonuclease VII small subunit [Fulvivirga sp.]